MHRGGAQARRAIEHAPVDRDLAPVQRGEAGEGGEQRGLARAATTHDRDGLSGCHVEGDVDVEVATAHEHAGPQSGGDRGRLPGIRRRGAPGAGRGGDPLDVPRATAGHPGIRGRHRPTPGRHPRTSSSTAIAVTSSSSDSATAVPCDTPAPLNAV